MGKNKYDFKEGDIVVFTKLIDNNPGEMMVMGETRMFARENSDGRKSLMGIKCMWFDKLGIVTNDTFNFKDIAPSTSKEGQEVLAKIRNNDRVVISSENIPSGGIQYKGIKS